MREEHIVRRICVCTSYAAEAEPRAPRHAVALAEIFPSAQITFFDCAPYGIARQPIAELEQLPNLRAQTLYFSHREHNLMSALFARLRTRLSQSVFKRAGLLFSSALSSYAAGLESAIVRKKPDIVMAHNIDALMPAARAAQRCGARLMFDCMEYYSEMGDSQTALEKALIRAIESRYLPMCRLVLASSDQVADALVESYGIRRPLALYNVPPVHKSLPAKREGFNLYWRNATIGFGQRGLEDALAALRLLPDDVHLHLQGYLPEPRANELRAKLSAFAIAQRVSIHPPYLPHDAVPQAAQFTIGLCLERKGVKNQDLTVSNKMFDYHMAGLAVVASDLPGLRAVLRRSKAGSTFEPGSAEGLANRIKELHSDSLLLKRLSNNARTFALENANREVELTKFKETVAKLYR